jgi:hypothetical protein
MPLMKFASLIVFRFVCLLLMIHLLAINIRGDYYISFTQSSNISKDFDIEEESIPKSKSTESNNCDNSVDDFLSSLLQSNKVGNLFEFTEGTDKLKFYFSINAFPLVHYEIQSPPPRA